jgi:hypothetical protein
MTEIEKEMTSLRELARELGPKDATGSATQNLVELSAADAELAALRSRVQKDPLGVGEGIGKTILPRISALRARLMAERSTQERALRSLARARELRRVLAEGHDRALRAEASRARELLLAGDLHQPQAVDPSLLLGLDQWLGKLEAAAENRRWSGAEVGLARWLETAEQYRAADALVVDQVDKALALRAELSGRLSARRAQAGALRAKGLLLEASLEAVARRADELLRARPTPIAEANSAVESFEAGIVALSARR